MAFDRDGTHVASASWDKNVQIWDLSKGAAAAPDRDVSVALDDRANSVAFSPDGKQVVTGGEDKMARVWDAATGKELAPPRRHRAVVWSVAFTPDGKRLVSACWEKEHWVHAWYLAPE